ncbi:MAG: hypothetical protein NTX50_00770 [Candidatus Sumerlaeota bacterium]|nr:hypothetical protein [Candidatus Sumerlaeota bacterium]
MMTLEQIQSELAKIAQDLGLKNAETKAEKPRKWVHVLIASEDFEGKAASERDNIIWREFERRFDDDTILSITQCYLLTPEQRKETGFF